MISSLPLSRITESIQYGYTTSSSLLGKGPKLLRITDIQKGSVDWESVPRCATDDDTHGRFSLRDGDIVFARSGATVGKSFLIQGDVHDAVFASYLIRVRFDRLRVEPRYAYLFFASDGYWAQVNEGASGTGQPNFNGTKLAALQMPVPPLAEQRRIVERVEALFARTRRARADLERIAPLSIAFRQRSLKRTFADAADASKLVPLGSLLTAIEAGKNMRCDERRPRAGEKGIVKISAVTWGRFDPGAIKTAPADAALDPRSRIADGEFLMSRANTLELVGAPVIATDVPPNTFLSDKVLRLRFRAPVDRWVLWFLRSSAGRQEIEARSSGNQLSMRNIGQGALREIPIPLPDAASRTKALDAIERGEERTAAAERDAARGLDLLDRLEQSILARAFRGELVPQDTAETGDATGPAAEVEDAPLVRRCRMRSVAALNEPLIRT